ncbi:MAG: RNA repair domain-containing protein [Candidatus Methanoperedens sp.]
MFNEIKWRFDLRTCKIYYIHRGAPGNVKVVTGSAIKNIDRSFLVLEGVMDDVYIPYHRIFRIEFDDQIIFERPKKKNPGYALQDKNELERNQNI